MKNALYQFVLGLAYALERASAITPRVPLGTKVYLFPLSKRAMFSNLMRCADSISVPEGEMHRFLRSYVLEPAVHEQINWINTVNSFDFVSGDIPQRSVLLPDFRPAACEFYDSQHQCFDFLVKVIVQEEVRRRHEFDLIFGAKDQ